MLHEFTGSECWTDNQWNATDQKAKIIVESQQSKEI